jgi:predicted DNA-binding protein (UPF0251 family)
MHKSCYIYSKTLKLFTHSREIMARNRKHRFCRFDKSGCSYKPRGTPMGSLQSITIPLDAFEALRLCDYEKLEQTEAGERMNVSRGTIQRLLEEGRRLLLGAIIDSNAFSIGDQPSCCGKGVPCDFTEENREADGQ